MFYKWHPSTFIIRLRVTPSDYDPSFVSSRYVFILRYLTSIKGKERGGRERGRGGRRGRGKEGRKGQSVFILPFPLCAYTPLPSPSLLYQPFRYPIPSLLGPDTGITWSIGNTLECGRHLESKRSSFTFPSWSSRHTREGPRGLRPRFFFLPLHLFIFSKTPVLKV